jgi:hypothetical protein
MRSTRDISAREDTRPTPRRRKCQDAPPILSRALDRSLEVCEIPCIGNDDATWAPARLCLRSRLIAHLKSAAR